MAADASRRVAIHGPDIRFRDGRLIGLRDGSTLDQLEQVASSESRLLNLGNGYYQLNWKSSKSYANSCRAVRLDLGEGVTRDAYFQFTR